MRSNDGMKRQVKSRMHIQMHVRKKQNPAEPQLYGVPPPLLAETEGFEPSIQVLAQMLP